MKYIRIKIKFTEVAKTMTQMEGNQVWREYVANQLGSAVVESEMPQTEIGAATTA